MRIFELARSLKMRAGDILRLAKVQGIEATSTLTRLEDADVKSIRTALAAALAGVSDEPPASWEEAAARLVELIQSLKSQFG